MSSKSCAAHLINTHCHFYHIHITFIPCQNGKYLLNNSSIDLFKRFPWAQIIKYVPSNSHQILCRDHQYLRNTKSYIFLTTLVDNEEVYHLAICGLDVTVSWGRSSVIICKLLHNLSPSPLLTICHHAPASLAFTLTLCML